MADARARREDETIKEWLARLARERHASDQLSSGRAQISDVTQPPVAPLVDIEPTVTEQVEQASMPNLFDQNIAESGGDGHVNLMNQAFTRTQPSGEAGWGGSYGTDIGIPSDMSFNEMYNVLRKGMLQKGMGGSEVPEAGSELYRDRPWLKDVFAEAAGFAPDLVEAGAGAAAPISQFFKEGWTGEPSAPDEGKFKHPIVGGGDWWAEHLGLVDTEGTYESWFSDKTKKQKGKFPYWPWKDSETPEEAELKLSLEGTQIAGLSSKDGTKGDVPAKKTQTPSVMGNSRSRMMTMMLGENPSESMDMAKMFEKAEGDYNTALVIGQLTGKGVGPANKFMSSFLQGAGLQYRMDNDKKNMAYNIMTTRASPYYWHDANDGIEPLMLFPWDPIPKGYVSNKPELTGQQRDRKQYREILDEFPNNREAGLDAIMDAYIANNPQIFSIFEGFEGSPQEIMESKYEHAARWATGMFNSGGGEHYTRLERQQFAAEWAKAEESDDWQWIIKTILRKQRGWPAAYDARVRARFGEK